LNKLAASLYAECKCDHVKDCEKKLEKLIERQVEAIGNDEFKKLVDETDSCYRKSPSEKKAREAQAKYFEDKAKKEAAEKGGR
jgi:hypothetical protein